MTVLLLSNRYTIIICIITTVYIESFFEEDAYRRSITELPVRFCGLAIPKILQHPALLTMRRALTFAFALYKQCRGKSPSDLPITH